ncbi:MAG: flavin oxidoreductase [Firmicutes bacterium]|nr:flavin oxidoreductase [Bacillota bacterium]
MKKNFGAGTWLYPMPVFIIGTYDENGNPDAMNAGWGGITDYEEITLALSADHKTTKNILQKKVFTVSMAIKEYAAACDYVGIVSANDVPNKLEIAGLHAVKSEKIDAPLIEELPLALECELIEYKPETGTLRAKIVNICAEEAILGADGNPDLEKFHPLIFNSPSNTYHVIGEKAGNAFKDGLTFKK